MRGKLTLSAKQSIIFFEEFVRKEEVKKFIKEYRKHLNLPESGIEMTAEDEKELNEGMLPMFYIPDRAKKLFPEIDRKKPFRVINTCNAFISQEGVDSVYIESLLRMYLFFNKVIPEVAGMFSLWNDLLRMEHLPSELADYGNEDPKLLRMVYDRFERIGNKYPIALYINPDASQRQIQDFLSNNWNFIEMYRSQKDDKPPKLRKKSKRTQERNDFIYENRHLPRRKIMEMLYDKNDKDFEIDYGYIGKIISLEKKRRENK